MPIKSSFLSVPTQGDLASFHCISIKVSEEYLEIIICQNIILEKSNDQLWTTQRKEKAIYRNQNRVRSFDVEFKGTENYLFDLIQNDNHVKRIFGNQTTNITFAVTRTVRLCIPT